MDLGVVLADPNCIEAVVKQQVLTNRNSVLFWVSQVVRRCRGRSMWAVDLLEAPGSLNHHQTMVPGSSGMPNDPFISPVPQVTLSDKRFCFDQGISGHNLMKTSMLVKV